MKKQIIALTLACVIVTLSLLSGCASTASTTTSVATTTKSAAGTTAPTGASTTATPAKTGFDFAKSDKMILGCLTYLTGSNMEQGKRSKAIIDYAVGQVNAAGGVMGKKLEVQYFDSGNDQQTVLNSVAKIIATEGMSGFFGCMYSSDTIAYMPRTTEAKMPSFTAGNSANVLVQNNPYIWMPRQSDAMVAEALAKMAIEKLGMKNPAIIYTNNASGQGIHDKVVEVLKANNLKPAIEISYDPTNTSNFTPIAAQLMNSKADGVILSANSADSSGILSTTAIAQAGFKGPKVTVPALFRNDTISQAKGALNGWYGLAEFDVTSKDPLISKIVADMKVKYPDIEPTWIEAVFYDSLMMLVEACEIANSTEPDKINAALSKLKDFKGMMGTHSFHTNHATPNGIYMANIENGKIVFGDFLNTK